jgi:hypothetical protein
MHLLLYLEGLPVPTGSPTAFGLILQALTVIIPSILAFYVARRNSAADDVTKKIGELRSDNSDLIRQRDEARKDRDDAKSELAKLKDRYDNDYDELQRLRNWTLRQAMFAQGPGGGVAPGVTGQLGTAPPPGPGEATPPGGGNP